MSYVLALALLQGDSQPDAVKERILKMIKDEIRVTFDRLRDEIRDLVRKELGLKETGESREKPPKEAVKEPPKEPEKGPAGAAPAEKKPGVLGINIVQEWTDAEREKKHLKPGVGVLIGSVREHGPAHKAGLKVGDVILKVNGEEILQSSFRNVMAKYFAGDQVTVTVLREDGKTEDLQVTLEPRKQ